MSKILGYHWVKSGYGLWLPGDERGHWSSAWDEQIGYIEHHQLHEGDPIRKRMAEELLLYKPVRFSEEIRSVIKETLQLCQAKSDWSIATMAIEETHIHVLLTPTKRDIDGVLKWLAQETTKAVHRLTSHPGPIWCHGRWRQYIDRQEHWDNTFDYVEAHNQRRGLAVQSTLPPLRRT